jgi:hypothetical protein
MDGEYEAFERCTCGHTYDNHVEGGRCGERDGCDEFHDPNHRVLQRLDEIEDLIQYLTSKVSDLTQKKRRP